METTSMTNYARRTWETCSSLPAQLVVHTALVAQNGQSRLTVPGLKKNEVGFVVS